MKEEKQNVVKMTYDIVFKKFFTDKPEMLKLILKHFLEIDSISDIRITNPEIPELEEVKVEKVLKGVKKQKREKDKNLEEREGIKNQPRGELAFLDSSLPSENIDKKRVFLDLRVRLCSGENINVEMQSYYEKNFLNRILYYWAKLHAQSLKKGEGYGKITPTYSLLFTEQPFLNKRVKDFMSSFSIRRDSKPYILFNKDLRIVIVELSKLKKSSFDLLDFKELWCYFIKSADKLTREDRKYLSRYKELEEAMEHFDELSNDERIRRNIALDKHMSDVIHHLDKSGWIEFGEKKGLQKGREEGKTDLILKMLEKGCSILELSKMTDLSESEILKLKNKKKSEK